MQVYYRDSLLVSKDNGIEESLAMAKAAELQYGKDHHGRILSNNEIFIDCLFSGNVSAEDAKEFFFKATKQVQETQRKLNSPAKESSANHFITGK